MFVPAPRVNPAIAESIPKSSTAASTADTDLVQRLRVRDPDAFDHWVREESPAVHRLVSRLLGWQHDCDDVVQEVFVVAWQKIGKFRGDSEIRTWLFGIAINQCRRQRRRYRKQKIQMQQLQQEVVDTTANETTNQSPDIDQLRQAMNELSQRDRELIVVCGIQQVPIDQAARLLGARKNTVEVRLHRARQRLKQLLQQKHD